MFLPSDQSERVQDLHYDLEQIGGSNLWSEKYRNAEVNTHLVFISNRLVDVDSIFFVAIVCPTILPVSFLRPSVGEPEELCVGGITTKGNHLFESRVLPTKVKCKDDTSLQAYGRPVCPWWRD